MKSKIALLLIISIILGCSKSSDISRSANSAYEHLEKFEFDLAKEAFNSIAAKDSASPFIRYANGLILEQQRYYFDALNEYLYLSEQHIGFAPAFSGIYRIYTYYGYYDKALVAANRAYEYYPDSAHYAIDQFRALTNYNRYVQARELVTTNRALDEISSKLLLSTNYCSYNEYDSALAVLKKIDVNKVTSALHFELMADALEAVGLIDSSMAVSRKAADHPNAKVVNINSHFSRAIRNNYYLESRHAIELLKEKGADSAITLQLKIIAAKDRKDFPLAITINADLATKSPKNVSSLFFDLNSGGPQYSDVSVRSTLISVIHTYLETLGFHPEVREFVKAEIEHFKAGTDDKVSAWNSIRKLVGEFARTKQTLLIEATLRYKTGQFDDALKYLAKLGEQKRNDEDWLIGIADIYADPEINKHELAQETYKQVLTKNNWNRKAFYNSVNHLRRIKRIEDALKLFEEYPNFEKVFPRAAILKALCLLELKQYDSVFEIVESSGRQIKGDLAPFYEMMTNFEKLDRTADIKKLAGICGNWAKMNTDILNFAAIFLNNSGNFDEALSLSERALSIEPRSVKAMIQKARALYGLGKREESFEIFESVLAEHPANGDANYYFSAILAKEQIDAQRTTNMARSAVRAFYSVEKADLNLCKAYLAFDMNKFAYGGARTGTKDYPDNPEFYYVMGVASNRLGRADVEKNLKKAIELGLKGDELNKAKEILAKL